MDCQETKTRALAAPRPKGERKNGDTGTRYWSIWSHRVGAAQ